MERLRSALAACMVLHLLVGMLGQRAASPYEGPQADGLVNRYSTAPLLLSAILWTLYTLVPLKWLPCLRNYDSLDGSSLDTQGIKYSEVEEKLGYRIERSERYLPTPAARTIPVPSLRSRCDLAAPVTHAPCLPPLPAAPHRYECPAANEQRFTNEHLIQRALRGFGHSTAGSRPARPACEAWQAAVAATPRGLQTQAALPQQPQKEATAQPAQPAQPDQPGIEMTRAAANPFYSLPYPTQPLVAPPASTNRIMPTGSATPSSLATGTASLATQPPSAPAAAPPFNPFLSPGFYPSLPRTTSDGDPASDLRI